MTSARNRMLGSDGSALWIFFALVKRPSTWLVVSGLLSATLVLPAPARFPVVFVLGVVGISTVAKRPSRTRTALSGDASGFFGLIAEPSGSTQWRQARFTFDASTLLVQTYWGRRDVATLPLAGGWVEEVRPCGPGDRNLKPRLMTRIRIRFGQSDTLSIAVANYIVDDVVALLTDKMSSS